VAHIAFKWQFCKINAAENRSTWLKPARESYEKRKNYTRQLRKQSKKRKRKILFRSSVGGAA